MKIAIVSRAFPASLETSVHGLFQRLGMFIDAIKDLADIRMLFYTNELAGVTRPYLDSTENKLANHWGTKLKLSLCPVQIPKASTNRIRHYLAPVVNSAWNPVFSPTSGNAQVTALRQFITEGADILFVHRLNCMVPTLKLAPTLPPVYFDLDDVEHLAYARTLQVPPHWPLKKLHYLEIPLYMKLEKQAMKLSNKTFVCSEVDRRYLSNLWHLQNIRVIPNAVAIPAKQQLPKSPTVLFIGTFAYPPNSMAADHLIKKIWPLIKQRIPEASLYIAGNHCERIPSFRSTSSNDIHFLGFVENLDALYKQICIVCCPIHVAGGTRIKIIEAAAYGKPVVTTRIGAEGLEMRDGEHIIIRDSDGGMANACAALLSEYNLAQRIGQNGREFVLTHYRREKIVNRIKEEFSSP